MKYSLEVETQHFEEVDKLIKQYITNAYNLVDKTEIEHSYFSQNIYSWKLSMNDSNKLSTLLRDLENEKNKLLVNFSINVPLLEELFINLEKEIEEEYNGKIPDQNKAIELPQNKNVKRPGTLKAALRLSSYRIRIYIRKITYIFLSILIPVTTFCVFLPIFKDQYNIYDFDEKMRISSSLYKNHQWNYDIQNSPSINNILSQHLVQQEFSKHSNSSSSLDLYTENEMNKLYQSIKSEPYYVSSFSGDINDNIYHFNINYNDSMVHSLPATINALINSILSFSNVNDTIQVNYHTFKAQRTFDVYSVSSLTSLFIYFNYLFPLFYYGTNVIRERSQNLLKQLQLNGISNKSYWISVLITDHFVFLVTCVLILMPFVIFKFIPLLEALSSGLEIEAANTDDVTYYTSFLVLLIASLIPNYGLVRVLKSLINFGIEHNAVGSEISFLNILIIKRQVSTCFISSVIVIGIYIYLLKSQNKKI
ncbi:hypothetical protein BCR36DRAFT_463629 [Piromyces finnis]|uniref:ABC-2 type transporter transmembrane domain-containing protein n=1 Tax=Piromyces finnis TaxID=1754191 RepID=A0A1Y1UWB0_9FUNG|nr:hypothetical protein BCR36DRAFT_463629 [Piromyces finnis]|eukprot:ORX42403.1 hypothetical protein BCR36DRAFT_463629 [Piromyces finnis]